MRTKEYRLMLLVVATGLAGHALAEAQYTLRHGVFGNGGAAVANGNFQLTGTAGQPVIGVTGNASTMNHAGFWYQSGDIVTGVEHISNALPAEYRLEQNYPNPFNPSTTIQFALPAFGARSRERVQLKIFDVLGRLAAIVLDEELPPGEHKVIFDASTLPSGVYFYRLQSEKFSQTRKLVLMR
jgi:hypothetical protein